jgi:3-phenylpropionate/trans-cinnamate dioxygenase ferredoxin reductase subunit
MEEFTRYLLVGGGVASVWAAQNIRERDSEGRIILVGGEKHPPYDRPPLSKQYLIKDDYTAEDAYSKFDNFYPDNRIQLHTGVKATAINRTDRVVTLEDGHTIRYEKLLLATGSSPRRLEVPGSDLQGLYYLRTVEDSEAIRIALQHSRRAVIVGAGYIGVEVAAACIERGISATVIEPEAHPWPHFASPTLGGFLRGYLEARGVAFLLGQSVASFEGKNGHFHALNTTSGERVEADFAVIGVGITLNTQLAADAGLALDSTGAVMVNEFLQTSDPHIWAAGDIAAFQDIAIGRRWHAEHHLNAKWQGRAVGAIMAGEEKPYDQVAYFFSDFLDLHMILRGDPAAQAQTKLLGDLEGAEFVELYADGSGQMRKGIAVSREEPKLDAISDRLEELIRAGATLESAGAESVGM